MRLQSKTRKIVLVSTLICLNLTADAADLSRDFDRATVRAVQYVRIDSDHQRTCRDALRDMSRTITREITDTYHDLVHFVRHGILLGDPQRLPGLDRNKRRFLELAVGPEYTRRITGIYELLND